MSLVTLSPPMGIVEEYQRLPRSKMATSVVPAPMSMSPTPSSRSSGVRTEALVAIWLRTISSMATPALWMQLFYLAILLYACVLVVRFRIAPAMEEKAT